MVGVEDFEQIIGGVLQHQHIYRSNPDFEDCQQVCREKIWSLLQSQPDLKAQQNPYLFMVLINLMRDFGRKQARNQALQTRVQNTFQPELADRVSAKQFDFSLDLINFFQILPTTELKVIFNDMVKFPEAKINERCQRLDLPRTTFKRRQRQLGQMYLRWHR